LKPNDDFSGRTALLTSKCCILYIYSTNIGIEYFKHGIYSLFFSLQNAVCFINLTYLVPVLFTFYIHGVLKLKKNNSGAKRLVIPPNTFLVIFVRNILNKTSDGDFAYKTAKKLLENKYLSRFSLWNTHFFVCIIMYHRPLAYVFIKFERRYWAA